MIEGVISGDKPIDLHPLAHADDDRVYECSSCGDRYSNDQVDLIGGLCPKDGAIFRPLGTFERKHPGFGWNWVNRSA